MPFQKKQEKQVFGKPPGGSSKENKLAALRQAWLKFPDRRSKIEKEAQRIKLEKPRQKRRFF